MTAPNSTLPASHPLLLELASLRTQLAAYQRSSNQTSIALQGSKLELSLSQSENARLSKALDTLKAEVETLRRNPPPPPIPPQSTALTELSLAHRRLSAKLDLTEDALRSAQLELASTKQELLKSQKEREGDKFALRDLRLAQDEWEEGMAWENGERRRVEEQKKLCDLAIAEYAKLVHSLDPSAVPPSSPKRSSTPNILLSTPVLSPSSQSTETPVSTVPATPGEISSSRLENAGENISNLLIGQNGVSRLLTDCTSLLTSRETDIRHLSTRLSELESSNAILEDSLKSEMEARISAESSRDAVLRDDAAAAKVVERYMTFTQKTHATMHMHLDNLRIRSSATTNTLRQENLELRGVLDAELGRGRRIKDAIDELSEGLAREAAERRREIALRLSMIASDELRDRRVEKWLDRVRMSRKGADGAVLDATVLRGLLDEGVVAVGREVDDEEKGRGGRWKVWNKRKQIVNPDGANGSGEEGLMRVLLAEELVQNLVQDLGVETDRRMELEKQRVEWLAREALGGARSTDSTAEGAGEQRGVEESGGVVFEIGDDDVSPLPELSNPLDPSGPAELRVDDGNQPTQSPVQSSSALVEELRTIFASLEERSTPLVKSLHDLSHSLNVIRASVPAPGSGTSPEALSLRSPAKSKPNFLSRRKSPLEDPALQTLLDGLHEAIEDARVDLEISRADEERVYRGFEALLGVSSSGAVQSPAVLADAQDYVAERLDSLLYGKLAGRIDDVEGDLAVVKAKIHELSGGLSLDLPEGEVSDAREVWESLDLKTVSTSTFNTRAPSPLSGIANFVTSPLTPLGSLSFGLPSPNGEPGKGNPFAAMGNMGRSFSAGIISAPRKVGGLAMAGGASIRRVVVPGKNTDSPAKGRKGEEGRLVDDDVE